MRLWPEAARGLGPEVCERAGMTAQAREQTNPRAATDAGSVAVGAALCCAALTLAGLIALLAAAGAQAARAATAADLAALAAADAILAGSLADPCEEAERFAQANGAELVECLARIDQGRVGVTVEIPKASPLGAVRAEAVAGRDG